ncbi:MAG: TonB-dependent receptor [Acidiphilium sp.]|nr:TonB-dependent receptor [Acidiphilium sp.]MDD4935672.1 TonB-dependent receptor [Acidiphilium sp.]
MTKAVGRRARNIRFMLPWCALVPIWVTVPARAQVVPANSSEISVPPAPKSSIHIKKIIVEASPLTGSGIDIAKWPQSVQVLTSRDISAGGTANAMQALNRQANGVNLVSQEGNPYQPSLLYHGFELSPIQGTPADLSVYVNGARFNLPFGDLAIWSLLPDAAIHSLSVEDGNPLFGLNALGGSVNVEMKNGFNYHGGELEVSGGSFDKIEGNLQYGQQIGNVAAYVDLEERHEAGWRDLQSSDIQNFYGDLGWRGPHATFHINATLADSVLNGPGTMPIQVLSVDPASQFTGPNLIADKYAKISATLNDQLDKTTSLQAVVYYDNLLEHLVNGNGPNDQPCGAGPYSAYLCQGGPYDQGNPPSTVRGGGFIPNFPTPTNAYGVYQGAQLDLNSTNTNGYGGSVQISNKSPIFGLENHVIAGLSYDGGFTNYDAAAYDGALTTLSRVYYTPPGIPNPGYMVDEPGSVPVGVVSRNAYYGAYLSDTLNVTKKLSLTVGGRFNIANIALHDQDPPDPNAPGAGLTGRHYYSHFNPSLGVAYNFNPLMTVYGGYSEANAAPTPAELSCASPEDSCSLANFMSGDPNLKQLIARTIEVGLRGAALGPAGSTLSYNVDYYHTITNDDVEFLQSPLNPIGSGYFSNVGNVKRAGFDAGLHLDAPRWQLYLGYSRIEATYQNGYIESSAYNPDADVNGNITIMPGDHLPGIPQNLIKFGGNYDVTPKWSIGISATAQTSSYLYGDEANLTQPLPGYFVANLITRYQITPKIQLFGAVDNFTGTQYYNYGTFSPTGIAGGVYVAQYPNYSNPRSYNVAAPVAGIAGVKIKF